MANYVYIAASLDGFIAQKDGGIEFLERIPNPEGLDLGWNEFIKNIDAIVMGKNSFQKVQSFGFWPYEIPVFVLSNSLEEIPEGYQDKAFLLNGCPKDIVKQLKERGFQNLYIDGGIVIQNFLAEDLIDHLIITKIPVLLGSGIPLFANLENPLWFQLESTQTHLGQLVSCHYKRQSFSPIESKIQ